MRRKRYVKWDVVNEPENSNFLIVKAMQPRIPIERLVVAHPSSLALCPEKQGTSICICLCFLNSSLHIYLFRVGTYLQLFFHVVSSPSV
jgi:hypothetical protein